MRIFEVGIVMLLFPWNNIKDRICNALVRANYKNAQKGIDYTPIYLERFFRNLLLGDQ